MHKIEHAILLLVLSYYIGGKFDKERNSSLPCLSTPAIDVASTLLVLLHVSLQTHNFVQIPQVRDNIS